jgi:hypothetical protein
MVKSKYSNDFNFGNGIVSCMWCDYKREFKATDSKNIGGRGISTNTER